MQSSFHRGFDLWLSIYFNRICCLQTQCLSKEQGRSFQVFDSGINSAQSSFPSLSGSPGSHKLFGEKQRFLIISFITRHLAEILSPKLYNSKTIRAKRLIYFLPIVGTQTSDEYLYIYIYIYIYIHIYIYILYIAHCTSCRKPSVTSGSWVIHLPTSTPIRIPCHADQSRRT